MAARDPRPGPHGRDDWGVHDVLELRSKVRCALAARAAGDAPRGTAMRAPGGVLLIEWPLPWPRDVADVPELADVVAAAKARGVRPLLVVGTSPPGDERMVCLHRTRAAARGVFGGYEAVERRGPAAEVPRVALALIGGEAGDGDGARQPALADVVICTHGRRDACCGASGIALHRELAAAGTAGRPVRWWRSSHQGGHHLAPTMLVLPDGTSWAHMDARSVDAVLRRAGPAAAVAGRYRGCTGLEDPHAQVLDAMALERIGWNVLDAARTVRRTGHGNVEVVATRPDGAVLATTSGVVETRTRRVPACGAATGDDGDEGPTVERVEHEVLAFRVDQPVG